MWFFLDSLLLPARAARCVAALLPSSETSPTCNFRKRWSKNLIFLRLDPSAVVVVAVYAQLKVTFIWATTIAHPQHTLSLRPFLLCCCSVKSTLWILPELLYPTVFVIELKRDESRKIMQTHTRFLDIYFFFVSIHHVSSIFYFDDVSWTFHRTPTKECGVWS